MDDSGGDKTPEAPGIYIEDGLILLSIGLLFVLTIFFRREAWAQWALGAVFLLMLIVFVRRFSRAHRAFKGRR